MSNILHDLRGYLGVVLNDLFILSTSSNEAARALQSLEKGLSLLENIDSEAKQEVLGDVVKLSIEHDLNIYLIDDNPDFACSVGRVLSQIFGEKVHFRTCQDCINLHIKEVVEWSDLIFLDLNLTGQVGGVEVGFEILEKLRSEISDAQENCAIWILSGSNSYENGRRGIQLGARGFISKPATPGRLAEIVLSYSENRLAAPELLDNFLVGDTKEIAKLKRELPYVAFARKLPVLILGETGSGKSMLAKLIHDLSHKGEFVKFNPTTSSEIMVSELLGYEKGAFTGASQRSPGLIKKADGGTLFIDEFDALPLEVQTSLLGVLQDGSYRHLGGREDVKSNFRLIVATNKDPATLIQKGTLREDFFHRVAGIKLSLPPLRERKDDIVAIAMKTRDQFYLDNEDLEVIEFADSFLKVIRERPWLGNVRELRSFVIDALYRSIYLGFAEVEVEESLARAVNRDEVQSRLGDSESIRGDGVEVRNLSLSQLVEEFKISKIEEAMANNGGSRQRAAEILGIDLSTLGRILKKK